MYEWLRDTLVEKLRLPEDVVTPEATVDAAGLDSLAVTELSMIVQEEFGVAVDEDELAACATVGEVAALLDQRCPQSAAR
ncbi:acyl carrier protein [Streptomyces sp. NPDC012421]|uniref:acyl carrier protein n=1 Tax=unclassified Streptomyces TaxID=2593676 RepID=UPI0036CE417A